MKPLSLIGLLSLIVALQQDAAVGLGAVPISGKPVEASVPAAWTDVADRYRAAKPAAQAPVWRVRVIAVAAAVSVRQGQKGVVSSLYGALDPEMAAHRAAQIAVAAQAAVGSSARVVVDLQVEPYALLWRSDGGSNTPTTDWMVDYIVPIVNFGAFQAEDREFRGPYDSIVMLHGLAEAQPVRTYHVSGLPVGVASGAEPQHGVQEALRHLMIRLAPGRPERPTVQPLPVAVISAAPSAWSPVPPHQRGANWVEPASDLPEPEVNESSVFAAGVGADPTPEQRSRLRGLLAHTEEGVRLNVLQAYARVRDPEAVAALIEAVPSYLILQSELALKALAHQNTDEAWQAIRRALLHGPTDHARQVAAELSGQKQLKEAMADLTVLLTARSWSARRAAAEALGAYRTRESQTMNLVFLHESHPAVRLAVTKAADPRVELVAKRLNWAAVNDPSDEVRAWSYIRLTEAGEKKFVEEGYKGVRDDSVYVRLRLLGHIQAHPAEASRRALQLATADPNPEVRVAALAAWSTFPGEVGARDLGAVWSDQNPEVRQALEELASKRGLTRPPHSP